MVGGLDGETERDFVLFEHNGSGCCLLGLGDPEVAGVISEHLSAFADQFGEESGAEVVLVVHRVLGSVDEGVFTGGVAVEIEVSVDIFAVLVSQVLNPPNFIVF